MEKLCSHLILDTSKIINDLLPSLTSLQEVDSLLLLLNVELN
jgi:hypothetical protein